MKRPAFILVLSLLAATTLAQPAPDFTITTTHSETVSLYADYLDQGKAVVIKVMFVDCPPCNSIAPFVQDLYEEWGGAGNASVEFVDLSIRSQDSNADMAGYEAEHGLTFPGAGADGGSLAAVQPYINGTFGPYFGTPTFVVIAPNGSVEYDPSGSGTQATIDSIDAAIQRALDGTSEDPYYNFTGTVETAPAYGQQPLSGIEFTLDPAGPLAPEPLSPETSAQGTYEFEFNVEIPTGSLLYPAFDGSGYDAVDGLTSFDLRLLLRHINGNEPFGTSLLELQADVNGDGSVNVLDAIAIRKVLLSLESEWPGSSPNFRFASTQPVLDSNGIPIPDAPHVIVIEGESIYEVDFFLLKIGDLNGSFTF